MKSLKHLPWTEEELELLGKIPDGKLSKRFGRTIKSISKKRERLGISKPNERWMTDAEKTLLGTMTDEALAAKSGRSVLTIKKWRRKLRIPILSDRKRGRKKKHSGR